MDLISSVTEAGLKYHRFHEVFSHVIKTNVIGLIILEQWVNKDPKPDDLKKIVYEHGGLWGGMPAWNDPLESIARATADLGLHGVVRVFSAFDAFMQELEAELDSYASRQCDGGRSAEPTGERIDEEAQGGALERLLQRRDWTLPDAKTLGPVFQYYRLSRNCIAHRNGIVSRALEAASTSVEINEALSKWVETTGHTSPPPIRPLTYGEPLSFTHKDAIFLSDLLRRYALDISRQAIEVIGFDGMVYLQRNDILYRRHQARTRCRVLFTSFSPLDLARAIESRTLRIPQFHKH
ncbi:MAG: hypothetical protein IPJ85_04275 [Flavobacteriales bacterium]|nr:hypothetical protein [Flavobacteriales bacterium]